MIFRDGAFRRWLWLDDVMRVGPHDGISALVRETRELSLPVCTERRENIVVEIQKEEKTSVILPGSAIKSRTLVSSTKLALL